MPPASRRKPKQAKKHKTVTILNHHSSHSDQLQAGAAVSANHSKKMEGSLNGKLQDSHKVETQTLREDKEVVVEVDDSQDGDIAINDEEAPPNEENKELVDSGKVEVTQEDVSESVCETFEPDAVKDGQVENTMESDAVELELKEEEWKDFLSDLAVVNDEVKETDLPSSESNNELFSVSGNERQRETEVVVETFRHKMFGGEEKNVLSSVVTDKLHRESEEPNEVYGDSSLPLTDVTSEETVETSVIKSDESDQVAPTIIEESLGFEPTLVEKIEEPSGGQEESSYESAKRSFQPSPSVPDAESTENPTIVPVAQRENTSWKSCCGLFEIMRGGDR